ncbi:MAG: UvrD-helicase domain-containing protein [Chloroflexota bacterium]|nr:UvrD-helicase domain-containing protein [Chloroflexota bacterium]
MTQPMTIQDQEYRDRIRTSLDENLFVEAGAGTGKTTALVGRIVTLVTSGRCEMAGLAAITFTEAAAAELRDRVRRGLEEAAADESRDKEERARCRKAVSEMDAASIQTLHSFAQSLLRERPLEAGLPPGFEMLDAVQADIRFQEAWEEWLDEALDSDDLGPMLARALHLGLRLEQLRQVAAALEDDYDLVEGTPIPIAPEPTLTIGARLANAVTEIERLRDLSKNGAGDPLYDHVGEVIALARRLPDSDIGAGAYERAIVRVLGFQRISTGRGRQPDWDDDPVTLVNGCKLLKDMLGDLEETRKREVTELRAAAFTPALEAVRQFVTGQVARRKRDGHAQFHDLLVWARDMLRDHKEARQRFQRRFHHILVDEFQDTDPIQSEIAFLLAGDPDDPSGAADSWEDVKPVEGKLFMVGDPKQSIYRFRRADIVTMAHVRERLVSESTPLQQNFRSQQSMITWVNHIFRQWMEDSGSGLQAEYRDLLATHGVPEEGADKPAPSVYHMGELVGGNAAAAQRFEGQAASALVRRIREKRWQVRDLGDDAWRDATYRDICILLPTRTSLGTLEQALETADVPYRIESESIVLGTEDVRQLLSCLRAIDSPGDDVSLVAALRSPAYACSDVELLQFADSGGRFDYQRPGTATDPVADALASLRMFNEKSGAMPPDEFIDWFIRERRLVELSFDRRRPRERWRRLRFVVEQAGAYRRAGGSSLRGFLDWIERQVAEGARAVESPAPESDEDCVRIMTIHAAKGLEFPIVLLLGFGGGRRSTPELVIVDRDTGRAEVNLRVSGNVHVPTAGYETASEREKAAGEAEEVRLAYVACTRARDHLIVSLFRREKGSDGSRAAIIESLTEGNPELFQTLDWQDLLPTTTATPPQEDDGQPAPDGDFYEERSRWAARREDAIAASKQPQARAVTAIAQGAKGQAAEAAPAEDEVTSVKSEDSEGEVSYRRGRGATNLGRAVHAALQSIDLLTGEGLEDICRAQAAAEGIDDSADEVLALSRNALRSGTVQGLRASVEQGKASYYREVFVSAELDGGLVEGFIDLLIDGPNGVSIVDYKTDWLTAKQVQELGPEYEIQLGLYAWAVAETTKRPVQQATLLFLRPVQERSFTDIEALVARAKTVAGASTSGTA